MTGNLSILNHGYEINIYDQIQLSNHCGSNKSCDVIVLHVLNNGECKKLLL